MDTISSRIAQCIDKSGMTRSAAAEKLKISQPYISRICSGDKIPSDRTISDICREFHVNEQWLRTGEGEMLETLDKDQELVEFSAEIMRDKPESFRKRFIAALSTLDPDDWAVLEKIADELAKRKTGP